jgi:CO dehydrogenase maturation factor
MSQIIAVAGKGGTGKTTIAALLIKALKEAGAGPVLAIDADPNSNLGALLGAQTQSAIVEIIDDISKNPEQVPKGVSKDRYIDMRVQESLGEEKGYDLLSMGRPEGPGCYCFANNMLRELIKKLMKNYAWVIIDNEAGMEHLSRRLLRQIDTLFMVSDNSVIGLRSAARISTLVDELNIKTANRFLVLNKSKGSSETLKDEIKKLGLELKAVLPFDEELEEAAVTTKSVFGIKGGDPVFNIVKELLGEPIVKKEHN